MTETTARLDLPLIAAGQAQKEVWHNEALTRIDALLHGAVETAGDDAPPLAPDEGGAWIVGSAPAGAWAGHAQSIAWWTSGGWRFAAPRDGMMLWVRSAGCWAVRRASTWTIGIVAATGVEIEGVRVLGPQQAEIAAPTGGTTVDVEARAVLGDVLATLRAHGLVAS